MNMSDSDYLMHGICHISRRGALIWVGYASQMKDIAAILH
jgi:hypothetical protein